MRSPFPYYIKKEGISIHFQDMPYSRVTYEAVEQRYQALIRDAKNAADREDFYNVLIRRGQLAADMTPMELCYVRHDMDVNDPLYAGEQAYYDEIGPRIEDLSSQFEKVLLASPHRDALEQVLGQQAVRIMEQNQQSFDSRLIPFVQEENMLLSRYNRLTSNASVDFSGKPVKRSRMTPFLQSADRKTRQQAALAVSASWEAQREELEEIYRLLVDNRTRQASMLGFPGYTEMSFCLMHRIGYGRMEMQCFREQVKRYLVPLYTMLEERRRKRLGLEKLYAYDIGVFFQNGNPKPRGDTKASLETAREMYTRLSPETAEFAAFLLDNGLCDVDIRDGKRGGGYMTFFEKYRAPFIFANFDGTSENAYIMCHEGGHAFQGYLKRNEPLRELRNLTSESAEIHAMAMEFFTWPYMELFFGERAEDYRAMHLEEAVRLIISECQQDEFQQMVYDTPGMMPSDCNALWAKLNRDYFPGRDYSGDGNQLSGCGWQRIPHVYQWPFYAIDYALAQVCALEYLRWMHKDGAAAWQSYLELCRRTGTDSFPALVRQAGLADPFAEGTLAGLAKWLKEKILML